MSTDASADERVRPAVGDMKVTAFRLKPGQELKGALLELAVAAGMSSAFVVTCVGSVRRATLRMAHATAETAHQV